MPCEGGEAVKPANEDRLNYNGASVSTPVLKNLCHVDHIYYPPEMPSVFNVLDMPRNRRCAKQHLRAKKS